MVTRNRLLSWFGSIALGLLIFGAVQLLSSSGKSVAQPPAPPAAAPAVEYKVIYTSDGSVGGDHGVKTTMTRELNTELVGGWEVVTIMPSNTGILVVMKRAKK